MKRIALMISLIIFFFLVNVSVQAADTLRKIDLDWSTLEIPGGMRDFTIPNPKEKQGFRTDDGRIIDVWGWGAHNLASINVICEKMTGRNNDDIPLNESSVLYNKFLQRSFTWTSGKKKGEKIGTLTKTEQIYYGGKWHLDSIKEVVFLKKSGKDIYVLRFRFSETDYDEDLINSVYKSWHIK